MSEMPVFGAGIWHFATYKDRYATEGYGPPVGLLEQIDKAGAVGRDDQVSLCSLPANLHLVVKPVPAAAPSACYAMSSSIYISWL